MYRWWVIAITMVITGVLGVFGSQLKVVIDPATLAPQGHPYIKATNRVEKVFGSKYLMLIGITPKTGDIFQPAVLGRIQRITNKLNDSPGIVKATMMSLAARQAKNIQGNAEGFEARMLMDKVPVNDKQMADLKAAILANPAYMNTVVSKDFKTAAILVELKERPDGFQKMVEPVKAIVSAEAGPEVDIAYGGNPAFLDRAESFAGRIDILFPIAILVIGLLHFEAFRTKQGLILPLVTAIMAVLWGTGFMGVLKQPMDIFNSPTPILILAIAAGHAVQLLKRYYEEYEKARKIDKLEPAAANREAVIRSLISVGPVMMIAGGVAALGFFSLLVFNIPTIRAFGVFTGMGIVSAVLLEISFIPAVRSLLPAPSDKDRQQETKLRIWDKIPQSLGNWVVVAGGRRALYVGIVVALGIFAYGMNKVVVDNSSKNFFASNLQVQKDDDLLNRQLGGTNSLYIMIEGKGADSMKDPKVLAALERTQRFAESQEYVGKTLSMVDFLKRMNQAVHANDPAFDRLPAERDLISQYLFLYSISGEPGDFDSYVDNSYKSAKMVILLRTGSNNYIKGLVNKLKDFTAKEFGPDVTVSFGGDVAQTIALTETMVAGKVMNIAQICLAVFVISALVFRSALAGVIVLTPLLLAIFAVFGVMGLFGIPLNIPNSLISAMAVGIGADYAIYMLYRMREQVAAGVDDIAATRYTLATAGKACLFVATAVAGGYGVLAFSIGYNVHQWLSMFIVIAMVVSAFASLTLVPAVVLSWRPAFIFAPEKSRAVAVQMVLVLVVAVAVLLLVPRLSHAQALSESVIIQKSVDVIKVQDSVANATFTLINKDGEKRVRQTIGYTKLQPNGTDNMRMVRFSSPADIKGTSTLLIEHADKDDDLWIYLPALKKVRRLAASNKKDSFVGTDFSYGDVIGYKTNEWTHRMLKEESVDGALCHVIESVPKTDEVKANSGYSKRISWIRKDNFVAVRTDITDTAGQALKRISVFDVQAVGKNGKMQAMRSEASNLQTGHKTVIVLEQFKAEQNLGNEYFTPRYLEQ